jgi:hypothetical protein
MQHRRSRGAALSLALLWGAAAYADVVYGPTEYEIASRARWIQGIAAIRVTWGAFLDTLIIGDADEAAKFLSPERRPSFLANPNRMDTSAARELRSNVESMPCRLEGDFRGICTATVSTQSGNLEDVRLPTVLRNGVWYITW